MDTYAIIWLVLLILFVGVEAATVMLVSIWFAIGALSATVTTKHNFYLPYIVCNTLIV